MRGSWITFLLVCTLCGGAQAEPALETFFTKHCVECHGPEKQKGKVRLDLGIEALFAPKEKALALERQLRHSAVAVVRVAPNGKAALVTVEAKAVGN